MNANIRTLAAVAALLAAGLVRADEEDAEDDAEDAPVTFERYRSITERYPFGVPPPNFDPTDMSSTANAAAASRAASKTERELTQEENKLKAAVRLCAFNLTPEHRVMVGFVDNSSKPPQSFYMAVGDSRGGWTVKSADVDERKAVIEKGGIEVEIEFTKQAAGPAAQAAAAQRGAGGRRMGPMLAGAPDGQAGGPPGGGIGALERLRERRAQIAKNAQEEEERRKAAAEKEKAEKAAAAEEREQQKQQLLQIQEELRRAREQREQREREAREGGADEAPPEG